MRISDWSSDVCSSDLPVPAAEPVVLRPGDRDRGRAPRLAGPQQLRPGVRRCLRRQRQFLRDLLPGCADLQGHRPGLDLCELRRVRRAAADRRPAGTGRAIRGGREVPAVGDQRSEEHTSELQSLMRISYAVFCLKKKKTTCTTYTHT